MQAEIPAFIATLVVNGFILFFAVALVRRKPWAPRRWLVMCALLALLSAYDAWAGNAHPLGWIGLAFRLGLLMFSVYILCTAAGSAEAGES